MKQIKSKKEEKEENLLSLGNILKHPLQFSRQPEEILQREVKRFGDGSAHVIVPKKHIGKEAQITIWLQDLKREKEEDTKKKS